MYDISVKRRATRQCRVVCGDWAVPWKLHNIVNLCALFDVGVGVTCASNAVHKVSSESKPRNPSERFQKRSPTFLQGSWFVVLRRFLSPEHRYCQIPWSEWCAKLRNPNISSCCSTSHISENIEIHMQTTSTYAQKNLIRKGKSCTLVFTSRLSEQKHSFERFSR